MIFRTRLVLLALVLVELVDVVVVSVVVVVMMTPVVVICPAERRLSFNSHKRSPCRFTCVLGVVVEGGRVVTVPAVGAVVVVVVVDDRDGSQILNRQ